jgi:Flp pilus assembly protein TadB
MSALVMTCLPGAMLALLVVTSGSARAAAVARTGLAVIAAGVVLNVAGWFWMRRLIAGTTR